VGIQDHEKMGMTREAFELYLSEGWTKLGETAKTTAMPISMFQILCSIDNGFQFPEDYYLGCQSALSIATELREKYNIQNDNDNTAFLVTTKMYVAHKKLKADKTMKLEHNEQKTTPVNLDDTVLSLVDEGKLRSPTYYDGFIVAWQLIKPKETEDIHAKIQLEFGIIGKYASTRKQQTISKPFH